MAIDDKLFRVYQEAHQKTHTRVSDLAKTVADKQLEEFSYQRRNEKLYHTWSTVAEYVRLLIRFGLIDDNCQPLINAQKVSKAGFLLTLGENVEDYANREGFPIERMKAAVKELLGRSPARLPTPLAVHAVLQISAPAHAFTRALSIKAYQDRVKAHPKQRLVLIIPDVLFD